MSNIRNRDAFTKGLWDWDFLNECFSDGIRVSDVDGIVERNGNLLFLEGKPDRAEIKMGQRLTYDALVRARFHVLIIYGPTPANDEPRSITAMLPWPEKRAPGDVSHLVKPATQDDVRNYVRRWYKWADFSVAKVSA